ncbi:restriction endonuclease subunit S [Aliikangiella coralliicola]|uniref:Restriction endonuclease subunit S n=1 Tax=Aliikangiella coralliicola TaxID=2592383 RepID=A0A545U764_9GAMM|nr:restriction endonuclease subunit S [Aliikangiella coralliicola]TQV85316.1 restriction endonuclease subunit S [Aliikangiella coralliicola]
MMMILKQVADIRAGYPFRGKLPKNPESNIFCIQVKDLTNNQKVNWSSIDRVNLTGKREPSFLQAGDILFNARGNKNFAFHLNEAPPKNTVCAPYFFILRIKPSYCEAVLSTFLNWQLNQLPAQDYFAKESAGSVTKNIKRASLENTLIHLPSPEQQKQIADIQSSLQREKETYQQLIENSQQLMDKIAQDLHNGKFPSISNAIT